MLASHRYLSRRSPPLHCRLPLPGSDSMNGIYRVLRMTLRYRLTLAGVFVSSLLMSALWSANIGVVYPFVEVVFLGKTMQEWAGDEISRLNQEVAELRQQVANAQQKLPDATPQQRIRLQ